MNIDPQIEQEQAIMQLEASTRNIARALGVFYQELLSQGFNEAIILALLQQYFAKLLGAA